MDNKTQLAKMAKALAGLQQKIDDMDQILGNDTFIKFFGDEIELLDDTFLTLAGIPEDTSVELGDEGYCRDYWYDKLFELPAYMEDEEYEIFIDELTLDDRMEEPSHD